MDRTRLCSVDDLEAGQARRFDVGEHRVALVRLGNDFHAVADRCSHADFSLSEGTVWPGDCEIECPKHGSAFSLLTGQPKSLPATVPVHVYPVTVENGDVLVELD